MEGRVYFRLKVPEWRLYHYCGEQTWQQSLGMVVGTAESSHLEPQAENRAIWIEGTSWSLKALGRASSSENTPPDPSQAVPPTADQVMIQVPENMGDFSFISSQKVEVYHPVCTVRVQHSKWLVKQLAKPWWFLWTFYFPLLTTLLLSNRDRLQSSKGCHKPSLVTHTCNPST